MPGSEIAQIITSIATLLGVIVTAYISVRNSQNIAVVKTDVAQVKHATNSLTDKLVASTAVASKAEGILLGRAEVTEEKKG